MHVGYISKNCKVELRLSKKLWGQDFCPDKRSDGDSMVNMYGVHHNINANIFGTSTNVSRCRSMRYIIRNKYL